MIADIPVSVIIPTYNRAFYLEEAIHSVMSQTYDNYEIIVVDDGSTDDTRKRVGNYGDMVRCIYQDNKGPSTARNNGIKNAKGDLIAFLDSDDTWHPEKLEKQVAVFAGNPRMGMVATGYDVINTRYEMIQTIILENRELRDAERNKIYKNLFATSTVMVKKECLETVGLFNEELCFAEDWDMWLRILKHYRFGYIPVPLMRYREHPAKITSTSIQSNVIDWKNVIDLHSYNGALFHDRILRRKRLSWLYLNQAVVCRRKDISLERLFMIKSIMSWPLCLPRRYSSLIKTLWRKNTNTILSDEEDTALGK